MGNPGSGVAVDKTDARAKLHNWFDEIDERLRSMVDVYQEAPSAIDSDVLRSTNCVMEVEAAIIKIYRIMKSCVYTKDSLLREDDDLWEAFKEQQDEFIGFYKSALHALESYKHILPIYNVTKDKVTIWPQYGDLELIRQDKHTQIEERNGCIEAVSDFCGKFSAMLGILHSSYLSRIRIRMNRR